MSMLRLKIMEVENVKVIKQQIKARLTWKKKECIITKDFFVTIKSKPNKVGIFALKDNVRSSNHKSNKVGMDLLQLLQYAL
jgi:hypothetical protein